uniref:Metalloendopeptidase n=1 Tax=Branchiostoma floridae TaxID=7739 RepID=C3ZEF2_BRAFL|eukprot:XP_002593097.1 hypothetical protein BRAFLDRAFT_72827 [Branchiostoma floridae]
MSPESGIKASLQREFASLDAGLSLRRIPIPDFLIDKVDISGCARDLSQPFCSGFRCRSAREHDTIDFHLNVVLSKDRGEQLKKILESPNPRSTRVKRKAAKDPLLLWPQATVPYKFDASVAPRDRAELMKAMSTWSSQTCVKFAESTPQLAGTLGHQDFITFVKHSTAMGLYPEIRRPDRDQRVIVLTENIKKGEESKFAKLTPGQINLFDIPFDYLSIMQWDDATYSASPANRKTIISKNPYFQNLLGQRTSLSYYDIKFVNKLYTCDSKCANRATPCPAAGYRSEQCACMCPDPNNWRVAAVCPGQSDPNQDKNCYSNRGEKYQGTVSKTQTGETCVPWNQALDRFYNMAKFPTQLAKYFIGPHNYCRNPDPTLLDRPWCYVQSKLDWDFCVVPKCVTSGNPSASGLTNPNPAIKTCDPLTIPKMIISNCINGGAYPPGTVCNLACEADGGMLTFSATVCQVDGTWSVPTNPLKCGGSGTDCYKGRGDTYRGQTSTTRSGAQCYEWTSVLGIAYTNEPFKSTYDIGKHKFCRNPDPTRFASPWCYRLKPGTNQVMEEACDIKLC